MDPRTAYREAEVRGATPVGLVIMLYEQAIEDLRQALKAIDENKIELRTNRINHAIDVIARLQVTLDTENGGDVARNLVKFYEELRANLCKAQFAVSKTILQQQITDLLSLREAWIEVDRAQFPKRAPTTPPVPEIASEPPARTEWKA
jgi:flagellar secretion chaperone FliS